MKKQLLALALSVGIGMLPVAAYAAEPAGLQAHAPSAVAPEASSYLGTYYYSPLIGSEEPTALSFNAGLSTQLQLNVSQSTLALFNTPVVQLKLYSGGLLVSSQTAYGSGTGTFYFSVTPGKSYYINVKNTGSCQVNGSFAAYLN